MRIYNRSAFAFGVFCGCALLFFAFDIIQADWWQWLITLAISGRYLYVGLSKTASENANVVRQRHDETAVRLYGKYALVKTNLPIILLAAFFGVALFIRFAFDITTPVSVAVVFCILLTVSVLYSISLERNIKDAILAEEANSKEQR
jgi:hypothetical protein